MELPSAPDYKGGSLVNLMAELEQRLTGSSRAPGLHPNLAQEIPETETYVLVIFDGLGAEQLMHPAAFDLHAALRATIDAPFPTTTTVSLSTIATGLAPSQHGILGYQLYLPEHDLAVNTIKWTTLWGDTVDHDTASMLPSPNLWERLAAGGVEAITVQPRAFTNSPLSNMLYRGCRFEGVESHDELVTATTQLAAVPGRLIVAYVPEVDFAAHVHGQETDEYHRALAAADHVWASLSHRVPPGVTVIGTADHGHVDFPKTHQVEISNSMHKDRVFYGDSRVMLVKGAQDGLDEGIPARWVPVDDMEHWWGPTPHHEQFAERRPDGVLLAEDDAVILHKHSDDRMVGHHGGLTPPERLIPILVRPPVSTLT